MSWRLSYQIGMAEQAANSILPAGGAGGLALGAWALNRGGMSAAHIGRRTLAFYLLTSLANFATLPIFAALFAAGVLSGDTNLVLSYGFGAAGLVAIVIVASVRVLGMRVIPRSALPQDAGRARVAVRRVRNTIGDGVQDSLVLARRRPLGCSPPLPAASAPARARGRSPRRPIRS